MFLYFINKNLYKKVALQICLYRNLIKIKSTADALANLIAVRGEISPEKQEEKPKEVKNGTCECSKSSGGTKFTTKAEEERWESIQFENALQNQVRLYLPLTHYIPTAGHVSPRRKGQAGLMQPSENVLIPQGMMWCTIYDMQVPSRCFPLASGIARKYLQM